MWSFALAPMLVWASPDDPLRTCEAALRDTGCFPCIERVGPSNVSGGVAEASWVEEPGCHRSIEDYRPPVRSGAGLSVLDDICRPQHSVVKEECPDDDLMCIGEECSRRAPPELTPLKKEFYDHNPSEYSAAYAPLQDRAQAELLVPNINQEAGLVKQSPKQNRGRSARVWSVLRPARDRIKAHHQFACTCVGPIDLECDACKRVCKPIAGVWFDKDQRWVASSGSRNKRHRLAYSIAKWGRRDAFTHAIRWRICQLQHLQDAIQMAAEPEAKFEKRFARSHKT